MPLWSFQAMIALAIISTLTSGIWLLLHLTAVAPTFAGTADIVPANSPTHASSGSVRTALAIFSVGLLVTLALMILVLTGAAPSWLE